MTVQRQHRKAWARDALVGVENALLPSFTPDLRELDEAGIRHDVRQAIAHGFFSTMCACETGLTLAEAQRFIAIACDEAAGRILVSFTLLNDSFDDSLALLGHAEAAGASHALLGYPQTFHPRTPQGIVDATRGLSEATNLGLVMYASDKFDFVRFHPSQIPLKAYDALADLPNVVSIKVGFGDPATVYEAFERYGDRVLVNVGTPFLLGLFPLLRRQYGAQWFGGGSWEMWQSPDKPYVVDYHRAVMNGELELARQLYWQLSRGNALIMGSVARGGDAGMYHWPFGKYIGWSVGANGGPMREPAMRLHPPMTMARKAQLRAIGIAPRENEDEFRIGRAAYAASAATAGSPASATAPASSG